MSHVMSRKSSAFHLALSLIAQVLVLMMAQTSASAPRPGPLKELPLECFLSSSTTPHSVNRSRKRPLSPGPFTPYNPTKRRILEEEGFQVPSKPSPPHVHPFPGDQTDIPVGFTSPQTISFDPAALGTMSPHLGVNRQSNNTSPPLPIPTFYSVTNSHPIDDGMDFSPSEPQWTMPPPISSPSTYQFGFSSPFGAHLGGRNAQSQPLDSESSSEELEDPQKENRAPVRRSPPRMSKHSSGWKHKNHLSPTKGKMRETGQVR